MAAAMVSSDLNERGQCKQIELLLDKALNADEMGQVGEAMSLYAQAETLSLSLRDSLKRNFGDAKLQERLDVYLANIRSRKDALSDTLEEVLPSAPSAPPTPAVATPGVIDRSASNCSPAYPLPNQDQMLCLSKPEVQMYSVSAEGEVSVPSYPSQLSINRLSDSGTPFLQLGDWSCPLFPGETPALLTGENHSTLMLPDPKSLRSGDSVAILLPAQLPPSEREAFLHLLARLTRLMVSDTNTNSVRPITEADMGPVSGMEMPPAYDAQWSNGNDYPIGQARASSVNDQLHTSDRVANGIKTTSELIARGLSWGAGKGSNLIRRGSDALKSHLEHSGNQPVDPRVARGAEIARNGSHKAVVYSGKAVVLLGSAAKSLSTWATPHVRRGAEKVLPSSWTKEAEPGTKSKTDSALTVASATLSGFGTVYMALEHGAKLVGRATASGTTDVVRQRYGDQAGQLTENMLFSVGNLGMTAHSLRAFGPKALALTAASSATHSCAEAGEKTKRSASNK